MPQVFETTHLWLSTLSTRQDDPDSAARERLRSAFFSFRQRAGLLAGEIHKQLPEYTVHDISHLDALWETASLIAGDRYSLTPTEAFVFGGAILLHDLGMALASYPDGLAGLKRLDEWSDAVTAKYRSIFKRMPSAEELTSPSPEIEREALETLLRIQHAAQAERLAMIYWQAKPTESAQYLIEDSEVRQTIGRVIGLIAHSHWWPISRLEQEFSRTLGAPHWCPTDWTIDPLKLACLIRVADASHLDARRAPAFLRALRKPAAYADTHWAFQEKLQKANASEDALTFTSGYAFPLEDASAWWLCLDALRVVDNELRDVDALLADKGLPRFQVRRVKGVESPERLVAYVPTTGWTPVDAHLQVSDIPKLVANLGGEELYGHDPSVALRELVQNGIDAINARRRVERRNSSWGEVSICMGEDEHGEWLEIEDNGIGMSQSVLTRYLLDFGTSYWGSALMLEEFPGLLTSGISPIGKYGIGFFAVFMLGSSVSVRTRRADAAQVDTLILEFNTGLTSRPILRQAHRYETIRDGGTVVRVWLQVPSQDHRGILVGYQGKQKTLEELCLEICPAIDVDLSVSVDGRKKAVICANDWIEVDGLELLKRMRVADFEVDDDEMPFLKEDLIAKLSKNLRLLINPDGSVVGRACIVPASWYYSSRGLPGGVVTVGGLRALGMTGIAGILVGQSTRASRDFARPVVDAATLADWASQQAELVAGLTTDQHLLASCARTILQCGGNPTNLPIAKWKSNWVSYDEISSHTSLPNELILLNSFEFFSIRDLEIDMSLNDNVLEIDLFGMSILAANTPSDDAASWPIQKSENDLHLQVELVVEAASIAWKQPVEKVLEASDLNSRHIPEVEVGMLGGRQLRRNAYVIRNPSL